MLKVLSLFSGIGSFEKALENIDEPFELINYCEIDKYASKAFSLIHAVNEGLNLGNITAINTGNLPNDIDVITYGFPCQDISCAGKQKGFTDENGDLTRSGLFFEALRIIEDTKPKFAIAENVKALTGKRFTAEFKIVLDSLNDAGYKNYWAVLNAKDYGIPQNRERVFIISIRNDINHGFTFPEKYELKLRLKDLLETNVDEKYYLSEKMLEYLINNNGAQKVVGNGFKFTPTDGDSIAKSITTRSGERMTDNFIIDEPKIKQIGNCKPTRTRQNPNQGRIYDPNGICPALNCCGGGNREPYVAVNEPNTALIQPIDRDYKKKGLKRETQIEVKNDGVSHSLRTHGETYVVTTTRGQDIASTIRATIYKQGSRNMIKNVIDGGGYEGVIEYSDRLRIRKLTPKECFRLMGFDDRDIDILIDNGISNTQLYKMAGNSIVVDVLEEIYVELLNQYCEVV